MFRLRLHPTTSGFAVGIAVIALWALLWLWFFAQLDGNGSPASERWAGTSGPELTLLQDRRFRR
jgi:hypothetical protein